MNSYKGIICELLKILKQKLYKDYNSDLFNENMNLYKFINVVYPEKLDTIKKILSNKLSFNILHSRNIKNDYDEKTIEYINLYKKELIYCIEKFEQILFSKRLSFNDLKWRKSDDNTFEYYPEYIEIMKKVVNNDGIIFIDTNDIRLADIITLSFILNKKEITILTNDKSKKDNIENWINDKKIIIKKEKDIIKDLKEKSDEQKQIYYSIDKYNKTGEKNEIIEKMLKESIEKIENLIGRKIDMEIDTFFKNIDFIISKQKNDDELDVLVKLKEAAKTEEEKQVYVRKIREKISAFKYKNENIEIIKKEYDLNNIEKNFNEIKHIYDTEIKKIDLTNLQEDMQKTIDSYNNYLNNKINNSSYHFINIDNKFNVNFTEKLNNIVIINNIQKYDEKDIENIIEYCNKAILIGKIKGSEFEKIYNKTSLFNRIEYKKEI